MGKFYDMEKVLINLDKIYKDKWPGYKPLEKSFFIPKDSNIKIDLHIKRDYVNK